MALHGGECAMQCPVLTERVLPAYALAMECPVLTSVMLLPGLGAAWSGVSRLGRAVQHHEHCEFHCGW
eukprot:757477-Rhodomonas_salina.7